MLLIRKKSKLNDYFLKNFSYKLIKNGVTSGGSRYKYSIIRKLPINIKYKLLSFYKKNNSGRSKNGRTIIFSKCSAKARHKIIRINYNFRYKFISFIANIFILPYTHKFVSMTFMSTGSILYLPLSNLHNLFKLTRMYRIFKEGRLKKYYNRLLIIHKFLFINQSFFILRQLPKNHPLSLLEVKPGEGIKYVRSPSTFAKPVKLDLKTDTVLVRLPSGVRKVFSLLSIGSLGKNPISENKYWKSNKSGYYRNYGIKPRVRGVAKNPIDHPHGGRTKSISYPRTPWGKTTKFK